MSLEEGANAVKLGNVVYSFSFLLPAVLLLTTWEPALISPARGLPIYLSRTCGDLDEYSNRIVVLQIHANGELHLDQDSFSDATLMPALSRIYEHRLERVLYVSAEAEVPYAKVVDYLAHSKALIPDLTVVLLPRDTPLQLVNQTCFSYQSGLPADH